MADVEKILRVYGKQLRNNVRLKALAERAYSYTDAQQYATKAAEILCDVLKMYMDPSTVTYDEALQIFTSTMQKNYSAVSSICARAQNKIYQEAGVGLQALVPEYNAEMARGLAVAITDAEEVTDDYVRNLVVNNSRKIVDEAIRENAEAGERMGIVVHITRRYDDVGLHNGKDVCEWCKEREGEWDDYQEAYNAGCFERHPGCGCVIDYHVGKTHTWSNSKGGWRDA